MGRLGVVLLATMIGAACVREGWNHAPAPGRRDLPGPTDVLGPGDSGEPQHDAVGDAPGDAAGTDADTGAAGLDPLSCDPPALVGTVPAEVTHLSEAALRTDRLELVARTMAIEGWGSSRQGLSHSFCLWTPSSLLAGAEDPTFFQLSGVERAVVARRPLASQPRHLELCDPATDQCQPITVEDQSGQSITDDLDGPTVAALSGGQLLLAFNRNTATETDIWLAHGSTADPTRWTGAAPVAAVNQAGVQEDDPALAPDGLALVFNQDDPVTHGDLYVAERQQLGQPFGPPRPLTGVNGTGPEGSAYLSHLSQSGGHPRYELFFSSERGDGGYLVYRAVCQR